MLGAGEIRGDERKVDLRLHHSREFDLRLFGRLLEPLQGHPVLAEVDGVARREPAG